MLSSPAYRGDLLASLLPPVPRSIIVNTRLGQTQLCIMKQSRGTYDQNSQRTTAYSNSASLQLLAQSRACVAEKKSGIVGAKEAERDLCVHVKSSILTILVYAGFLMAVVPQGRMGTAETLRSRAFSQSQASQAQQSWLLGSLWQSSHPVKVIKYLLL